MENERAPSLNRSKLLEIDASRKSALHPERVLQIGEGNFMRGFVDWMLYRMNENGCFQGKVVAIQPTPRGKVVPKLNRQDGLYTLVQRGIANGEAMERVERIDVISRGINPYENWADALRTAESPEIRFLFSNTTEAGLQWNEEAYDPAQAPLSFPGKLVALLYHRYVKFHGAKEAGWIILPCELVEHNGAVLKDLCKRVATHWGFSAAFARWLDEACVFCNTLVDRIVTGYPQGEEKEWESRLGYHDELLTVCEPYHLFVIEGPVEVEQELPFRQAGLHVFFDRIEQYRELKVKLLNAPHTLLAAVAFLAGINTVREAVEDRQLRAYLLHAMQHEIKQALPAEMYERADAYIEDVLARFANPYLRHHLLDISLNGLSKFTTRVLPSIHAYQAVQGALPQALVFGLAALLVFYRLKRSEGEQFWGVRAIGDEYVIRDQAAFVTQLGELWKQVDEQRVALSAMVEQFLGMSGIWGEDLNAIAGLTDNVTRYVAAIASKGIRQALREAGDFAAKGV
ncbi:tagaturonate reductase [Brevibacillus fulvus]|uniref:Tagaturonate reductase n=1 Tax=Brevibacillus fulvus TaxID=1125967 RepID=A0A939BW24_9BACL|nr:tagaturonate reductase [Brevibacillus fulvus]MBM7591346.1 tagaturonate reductase [Brevibacillus fulvus]